MNWVLDLDGVVWLDEEPISGAADAVARLRSRGEDIVFVTNNSFATRSEYDAKLRRHGIRSDGHVVTSAMAAASLIDAGARVFVCGGPGVVEAVEERGATVATGEHVDALVVGIHPNFDYERMKTAARAVRNGARFIATNDDATYPTPDGPIPGAGAILAGIEKASGVRAVVAGKPYQPMADLVRSQLGVTGIVVGDRPDTDGRFAAALGYRFALVLTGVVTPSEAAGVTDPRPDDIAPDLATLVERFYA